MGNELFGEYNIEKEPFLTGGYLNLWNIYRGIHKERKQNVCVFVFEKKNLNKFQKEEQNDILNSLKKEAQSLIKYKHPSILGIVEPLLEDKNSIGFVTEEFKYNLSSWVKSINPSKLEIKQMIIELCKVINFLHSDAHSIHTNFNPDNIFIDKDNKIKISGMNFAVNDPPLQGGEINVSSGATPNLSYCAPEIISHSKAFYSSDIFSIGCIIYNLLKFHKGESDRNLLSLNSNTVLSYNNALSNMDNKLSKCNFENEDINLLNKILNKEPQYRPGIKELLDNEWFNDPKLKALNFIENLNANEQSKNIEFLQKLPRIISMFENKIILNRFLPCLLNALKNESLINSCLPAIFSICENTNLKLNFSNDVWPHLKDLFKLRALPAASIYFLISKVKYIGDNISNSEFSSNFLNLICKAMDCNVAKIQTVVSENLNYITKKIDSLAFKNQIYPRILQVISNTNSRPLKIDFLKKLKELYTKLDQNIINESLLNNLEKIRKADNNNEICMTIADIYEEIAKIVNIEGIANKILPNLISILVGANITKTNFNSIMKLVQTYLERIRKSRFNELADDAGSIGNTIMNNNNNNNQSQEDNFMDSLLNQGNNNNKGNDKDDFLSSFFDNTQTNKNNNINNNNGINFTSSSNQNKTTTSTNNDFNFTTSSSNNNNTKSLFDGLSTNTQSPYVKSNVTSNIKTNSSNYNFNLTNSSTNKTTNTNDIFSNLTLNTNKSNNNPSSLNSNLNNINLNFNNNSNNNNNKNHDSMLNNLMNDLPIYSNTSTNTNSNTNQNNNNNLGGFSMNVSSNTNTQSSGFDPNNLDFLSGNKHISSSNNNNTNFNFGGMGIGNSNNNFNFSNNNNTFNFLNNNTSSNNTFGGMNNNNNNNNNLFANLTTLGNNNNNNNKNNNNNFLNF
jgi:SCY1-like protein 2